PMFNGSSNQVFETVFLNILLEWHNMDPVSQKEIDRNDAIYYHHQGNRNPFVDHPEYVNVIWNPQDDNQAPSIPTNLEAFNPSPNSIDLNWDASTDNIGVSSYDIYIDGGFYNNINSTSATVIGLNSETNYCFTVTAKDANNNSSLPSNQACETTTNGNSGNPDLFFSEYMEGSGNNKALEIANFSGNYIDLSNYELKLSSNGNSSWTINYSFPNNAGVDNADVYVVMNGGTSICTDVDDNLNNSITGFNGNDAIGLFKNGVLIDILGTLGNSSDYAKNTTLVRNADIAVGSTVFNATEWSSYPTNTCENLGFHTQTLGNFIADNNFVNLYPNPLSKNTLYIKTLEALKLEIYSINGLKIYESRLQAGENRLLFDDLKSGIYIFKFQSAFKSWVHKIIRL
ncbi:MAG: endonuclease, partial [Bacteroidota bacterium]|nr:endonuclease [Bacteroidota bacterium]